MDVLVLGIILPSGMWVGTFQAGRRYYSFALVERQEGVIFRLISTVIEPQEEALLELLAIGGLILLLPL